MLAPPVVEPAAPELAAHQRCVRACFLQIRELGVDVGACPEINRPKQVVQAVELERRTPVALEQRHVREDGSPHNVADVGDVFLIRRVGTVFVLHLHHDDVSAARHLQVGQLLAHLVHINLHTFQEIGVAGTQFHIPLQQPPRQSAHLPFGTGIGSRPQDDIHPVFLRQLAETCHIVVSLEIKLVRLLLMKIPKSVDTNGVHT